MAWPWKVALIAAALVHAAAEVETSCPAGELSCEQDEVGMLQSSATQAMQTASQKTKPELVAAKMAKPERAAQKGATSLPQKKKKTKIAIRRATKKSHQSLADVWDQLKGSVEIDQITAALKEASGNMKEELTKKLAELKEAFPAADEIKEKFSAQWDEITKGVNMEELQSAVESAKKNGAAKLGELQDKLQEAMKNVNLEDVQKKAEETWDNLSDQLPEMDDLKGTLDQYRGQVEDAWNEFTSSDMYSQAADAASQAWGTVTGWMNR